MSENIVQTNINKYNDLVDKAVPIKKEIRGIKTDINKSVNKCVKHAFDRNPAEFNYVKSTLHNNATADGIPRLFNTLKRIKLIVEYCTFLGYEHEFKQFTDELGIDINLKIQPNLTLGEPGYENEQKLRDEWATLFGKEPPEDKVELLSDLMELGMKTQGKLEDLSDQINTNLGDELKETGISKSLLNRGADLKIRAETKDDVADKVNDIVEESLLKAEAIKSII
jgi:hypothetical protein